MTRMNTDQSSRAWRRHAASWSLGARGCVLARTEREGGTLRAGQIVRGRLAHLFGVNRGKLSGQGRFVTAVMKLIHPPLQAEVHFEHGQRHVGWQLAFSEAGSGRTVIPCDSWLPSIDTSANAPFPS